MHREHATLIPQRRRRKDKGRTAVRACPERPLGSITNPVTSVDVLSNHGLRQYAAHPS